MIISVDNLRVGLSWFGERWGEDILNALYYEIYEVRSEGATERWWTATVDRLGQWHAYRGRTKPNRKDEIKARGLQCLAAIAERFAKVANSSTAEPSIADLHWEDAAPLFALASGIKSSSPVFPSKLCHFLFPNLFPPMDNEVIGVLDYEFYWRGMKDELCRFEKKVEARNVITEVIKSDRPIHLLYPFETKIIELSHMGYNRRRQTGWNDGLRGAAVPMVPQRRDG
jgi:hypothetical protein